ncbi:condensin complex subunit 2 isoform X2 [Ananas comosus]|uniref:Condensin complex subunit 2 n=1 Tax=Ananas comosus TaxID=4615 RepID=A0A6P5FRF3_ANACO|nr:condensin complex subunit 2 isoform X2 [Ananas comosus]XP_020098268.1 condensin complex subunit 2 isoform X2 [Ananas comosus]
MDLFHNCIKLASENKINQKNTWELRLIDHLSEIIQVRSEDDDETNFQKASCTLEAGVKIYSARVDSVHSEAYKVLGGINRAGREQEKEISEGDHIDTEQAEGLSKKDLERKLSPVSTLESSFEALNVKKFDAAFTVDPLYHQTSAQFDEGGAKGLLLYNLGVYGGCRVLFDSFEAPENSILPETQTDKMELIDLSFLKEYIEKMMINMPLKDEISPTLRDIVDQFDEDNRRPSDLASSGHMPTMEENIVGNKHVELNGNALQSDGDALPEYEPWNYDNDDQESVVDDSSNITNPNSTSYQEANGVHMFDDADLGGDEKLDRIADFLSLGLGFSAKTNAWAGPEHWKYRKTKGSEQIPTTSGESEVTAKKPKSRKKVPDIDFTKSLENDMPDIFAPPKNPKSLLLPANKVPCNITLPEDCHYRPESLVRLFLLPDVMCLGRKGRKICDAAREDNSDFVPSTSWDNGSVMDDHVDDENAFSDVEDPGSLLRKPRQVNKIDIQYDKVSKQVDVHALKDMLWNHIQGSIETSDVEREEPPKVSLTQVLHHFPNDFPAASTKDVSPHLFFICLLHLANEHCLVLHDRPTLDEVDIQIPSSSLVK